MAHSTKITLPFSDCFVGTVNETIPIGFGPVVFVSDDNPTLTIAELVAEIDAFWAGKVATEAGKNDQHSHSRNRRR